MSTTTIPATEVRFHPLSFVDPSGRLFWWQGQLYRGVMAPRAALYRELLANGTAARLIEQRLLIETTPTAYQLEPYQLVLKHEVVPYVSYAFEWSNSMLRDAALTVLDLLAELARHDLTLQDAHPWNILFAGSRPRFVDFGSITPAPAAEPWQAHEQFLRYFLYPLQLMAAGHSRAARVLLFDWDVGVQPAEYAALTRPVPVAEPVVTPKLTWRRKVARRLLKSDFRLLHEIPKPQPLSLFAPPPAPQAFPDRAAYAAAMRQQVEAVQLPSPRTEWSNYYDTNFPPFEPDPLWMVKHRTVCEVLVELKPRTVLDAGSNRGWYAQLAARLGSRVVGFDIDEPAVDKLYADARRENLDILPLVMAFHKPTPAYGLGQWFASATERFQSDLVLGLAIVHHLSYKGQLRFDQIVGGLAAFTQKWLLVEFIPREDIHVSRWNQEGMDWYHLDAFRAAVERHFRRVRLLPSNPEPRVMLLCEK